MRFGVSAKVFLAYAVLLVAFATTSVFSLAYLHGARQQVIANQYLLDVQGAIDSSWRHLLEFEQARSTRPSLSGPYFARARDSLATARERIQRFLAQEGSSPRRASFDRYLDQLGELERLAQETLSDLSPSFDDRKEPFESKLRDLVKAMDLFRKRLGDDSMRVIVELSAEEEKAVTAALFLGIAGLLVALLAALVLWRTLRPLQVLRLHARQIAGGDYARRIGLRSRDEIGDLAREFDAMAQAIEEREHQLIRSERLATVGRVAAQITHEIRNPLASIGLYAELLGDEVPADRDEGRRLLASISGEVDRLSEITESYLRFVRLPKPKLEAEDPGALVSSVLEFARAELRQAGIGLTLEVAPGLPEIAADENQIRQALLNLIRNAREAMKDGGSLVVGVEPSPEGGARVTVTDSGSGVAPEHLSKIFEPFFSTKEKGTGLGLALVHQIVSEHGGAIEVQAPPSGGTSFVLTFPAIPRPDAPGSTPEASAAGLATPLAPATTEGTR
jgi:two-component system NtrC family sensor kinase